MKIIQKSLVLGKVEYYEMHLSIINPLVKIPLANMEIKVLAMFMSLEGDLVQNDRFNTEARKIVYKTLNISNSGLGNYLKTLKDKGAIVTGLTGNLEIMKGLIAEDNEQFYQFKIKRQ